MNVMGLIKRAREFAALADKATPAPWKLIWHGNERYPFPLTVLTEDDCCWITRDGTVSSEANARLITAAPDMARLLGEMADALEAATKDAELYLQQYWKQIDRKLDID
jgi:hypothetical protein